MQAHMIKVHLLIQLNPLQAEAFGIGSTSQKWPLFFLMELKVYCRVTKVRHGKLPSKKMNSVPNFQHFLKTNCNMKQVVYAQSSEHFKEYF